MKVQYTLEAIAALDALSAVGLSMAAVVSAELDLFEAQPGLTRWKRRAYAGVSPRTFGFDIRGPGDDYLVLWQQTTDSQITVAYIGPPI